MYYLSNSILIFAKLNILRKSFKHMGEYGILVEQILYLLNHIIVALQRPLNQTFIYQLKSICFLIVLL